MAMGIWLVLHFLFAVAQKDADGWTCGEDGYWYENGVKSSWSGCADDSKDKEGGDWSGDKDESEWSGEKEDKDAGCTVTTQSQMPETLSRTCITHPSNTAGRCWWTYVPQAVTTATDGRKVPLVVDMHGGGGCAYHRYSTSGFKELADAEANAGGGMVVVWPQGGPGGLWASHGTSTRTASAKSLPSWDDVDFLEKLISVMLQNSSKADLIDSERIYLSGFSLGCMMAHRFALERSQFVAAFGCHGGELSFYPTNQEEMDSDKSTYEVQPMPVYITIGSDDDAWFPGAQNSWEAWTYWNGCNNTSTSDLASNLVEHVASSCSTYTPSLQTMMLVIQGGAHAPSTTATEKSWQFMSQYKRPVVLTELPEPPAEPPKDSMSSSGCWLIPHALFFVGLSLERALLAV